MPLTCTKCNDSCKSWPPEPRALGSSHFAQFFFVPTHSALSQDTGSAQGSRAVNCPQPPRPRAPAPRQTLCYTGHLMHHMKNGLLQRRLPRQYAEMTKRMNCVSVQKGPPRASQRRKKKARPRSLETAVHACCPGSSGAAIKHWGAKSTMSGALDSHHWWA